MIKIDGKKIFLACGRTDMRKQINGLVQMVQGDFGMDAFEQSLFVFCNRKRDLLKVLHWDENGFWLHLKRLEKGKFNWPTTGNEKTMALTDEELGVLLESSKLTQKLRRNQVAERAIF